MGDPSKPSSWMKDAHDVPKTARPFSAIGVLYLLGVLFVGFVTHRQKLKEIREEKIEKSPKCTEAHHQPLKMSSYNITTIYYNCSNKTRYSLRPPELQHEVPILALKALRWNWETVSSELPRRSDELSRPSSD
ncbi:unnamed protein product [Penicillium viridicatum]